MPVVVVTGPKNYGSKIKSPVAFGFMLGGLIVSGVFFILTVVFSVISWPPYADFLLNKSAISLSGQILEEPVVVSHKRYSSVPNRISMKIKLDIQDVNNVIQLTAFPSLNYKKGAQVEIEYLKNDLSIARIKGDKYGIFDYKIILIMLSGVLVGLVTFLVAKNFKPSIIS